MYKSTNQVPEDVHTDYWHGQVFPRQGAGSPFKTCDPHNVVKLPTSSRIIHCSMYDVVGFMLASHLATPDLLQEKIDHFNKRAKQWRVDAEKSIEDLKKEPQ